MCWRNKIYKTYWDRQQRGRSKEKKSQINQRHQKLREKLKSEKPRSCTHIHYCREITCEKKGILTTALYNDTHNSIIYWCFMYLNPNDDASPFIGKIRVTSCEISKLSLTCSPSFAGKKKTSRLNHYCYGPVNCFRYGPPTGLACFQTGPLLLHTSEE